MLNKTFNYKFLLILQSFLFRYIFKDIKFIFISLVRDINLKEFKSINFFLPKKIKKFSVVRSPTMSKLSKEQFEFRFFKAYLIFKLSTHLDLLLFNSFFFNIGLNFSYLKFKLFFKANV